MADPMAGAVPGAAPGATIEAQLERTERAVAAQGRELAQVRQLLETLVQVLIARGDLAAGHARLLERAAAAAGPRRSARLRPYVDKYEVASSGIDCPSLIHLCRARCSSFAVELTAQDIDEGAIRFELDERYMLRHERDGYAPTSIERLSPAAPTGVARLAAATTTAARMRGCGSISSAASPRRCRHAWVRSPRPPADRAAGAQGAQRGSAGWLARGRESGAGGVEGETATIWPSSGG